jgi:hypothetical protein
VELLAAVVEELMRLTITLMMYVPVSLEYLTQAAVVAVEHVTITASQQTMPLKVALELFS